MGLEDGIFFMAHGSVRLVFTGFFRASNGVTLLSPRLWGSGRARSIWRQLTSLWQVESRFDMPKAAVKFVKKMSIPVGMPWACLEFVWLPSLMFSIGQSLRSRGLQILRYFEHIWCFNELGVPKNAQCVAHAHLPYLHNTSCDYNYPSLSSHGRQTGYM